MIKKFKIYELNSSTIMEINDIKEKFADAIFGYVMKFLPTADVSRYKFQINIFENERRVKFIGLVVVKKSKGFLHAEMKHNEIFLKASEYLTSNMYPENTYSNNTYYENSDKDKSRFTLKISNIDKDCEEIERITNSKELQEYVELLTNVKKYNL